MSGSTVGGSDSLAKRGAKAAAPWRKGIPWWLVLLEGLVLLGVGIYMLVDEGSTDVLLGEVVALTLAVMGLVETLSGLRSRDDEARAGKWSTFQGAIGLVAGVVVFVLLVDGSLVLGPAQAVLGVSSVLFGLLGVYRYLANRWSRIARSGILMNVFFLAVGVLLVLAAYRADAVQTIMTVIAVVLVGCGVLLLAWALWLLARRGERGAAQEGS